MEVQMKLNEIWQIEDATFANEYDLLQDQVAHISVLHLPTEWNFSIRIKVADAIAGNLMFEFWGEAPRPRKVFKQFKEAFATDFAGTIRAICLMLGKTYSFDSMKEVVKKAAWWDAVYTGGNPFGFSLPDVTQAFDRLDMGIHTPPDSWAFYNAEESERKEMTAMLSWVLNSYRKPAAQLSQQSFTHFSL